MLIQLQFVKKASAHFDTHMLIYNLTHTHTHTHTRSNNQTITHSHTHARTHTHTQELLVAMQAIDELFNANQVNLQLLAVTPAFFSVMLLQQFSRFVIAGVKSSSRGRFVESTSVVHRDLRSGMRELERLLVMSPGYTSPTGEIGNTELGR